MTGTPVPPAGETVGPRREPDPGTVVRESRRDGDPFAWYAVSRWMERLPGLVAGVTAADGTMAGEPGLVPDFGLTTAASPSELVRRYEALGTELGFARVALARQVHGSRIVTTGGAGPGGGTPDRSVAGAPRIVFHGPADGILTARPGVLVAVTAADCVPVYLLHPGSRTVGLLHAGWRGIASGVLESALDLLRARGACPTEVRLHLGPAICGRCYEVGPEVPRALGLSPAELWGERRESGRLDLRATLGRRAMAAGVPSDHVSRSGRCTRCEPDQFHSHRGTGIRAGRMAAFLGVRRA